MTNEEFTVSDMATRLDYLQEMLDMHRAIVFAVGGLFLSAGAWLMWGFPAFLLAWGITIILFRVALELSPDPLTIKRACSSSVVSEL